MGESIHSDVQVPIQGFMPSIELRYRTARYVVDAPRGRTGARVATLHPRPPDPVPQIDWEEAGRRIVRIRREQAALLVAVGLLSLVAPLAAAPLHGSDAVPVAAATGTFVALSLSAWFALDRSLRSVVEALGQSARVLAGLAATDPLTELPNHRAFQERLHQETALATRAGGRLALILIDIDHFKGINDTHGHPVGDRVVTEIARRLASCARAGEIVARTGGDEFAWLLPGGDAMDAWQAAERARSAVESMSILGGLRLTISAGVCELGRAGSAVELLRLADGALYWAKVHGRNRCVRYSPDVVEELSADDRAARLEHQQAMSAILALARAVDAKDPYTMRHSERVADMAARLGLELGWTPDRLRLLHEAAVLHDVGKIAVPDAVLAKPGALTKEEFALVREHSARGAEIVAEALTSDQVSWVRGHHERFDGGGYPDDLAGAGISDGARVIALADAWDAMTSDRPYRPGIARSLALEICRAESGAQFAPEAVDALVRLWHSGGLPDADAPGDEIQTRPPLKYRGVAAAPTVRRRDRPPVSGAGLVYRGLAIPSDDEGGPSTP